MDSLIDNAPELACDGVLPAQFYNRATELSPEQQLWLAVLNDAIDCWKRRGSMVWSCYYAGSARLSAHSDANNWIFGNGKPLRPGALDFSQVCEVLNIEPEFVRANLKRWAARHDPERIELAPSDVSLAPQHRAWRRMVRPGHRRIAVGA